MVEYTKVNVRLSYSQLKKLKGAVSNNTGTTLRISLKCLMVIIYRMNYYLQQEKNKNRKCFQ